MRNGLLQGIGKKERREISPAFAEYSESSIEDEHRYFDLTTIIEERNDTLHYHRLDRLFLTLSPRWGEFRIGRQAVTWGSGFLFNPMDLFNPFAPTDIEREYKTGDDMALLQIFQGSNDIQVLVVPRRNIETGTVENEESSLAAKGHFSVGRNDFDLLLANHYQDDVVGLGTSGYLGNAVWRIDATYTYLNQEEQKAQTLSGKENDRNSFAALVANIDYSWMGWGKNWYGFLEFYYNSLPEGDYTESIADPAIMKRLERGELTTLGNGYLGGRLRVELHPLVNTTLTLINNLGDGSGIVQPGITWNLLQNWELSCGGTAYYGSEGTEYGGFDLPGSRYQYVPSNSAYLWISIYF